MLTELERMARERDLYRQLLDLEGRKELRPLLEEALALVVATTGAHKAYLELHQDRDGPPQWWLARGFSEQELVNVRAQISQGIIGSALASGKTILTANAKEDPTFARYPSVILGRIEQVLCAPVGSPPLGVVYLQGRDTLGPFKTEDVENVELLARSLGRVAGRLLAAAEALDATSEVRRRFRAEGLVGRSPALAAVLQRASLLAPLDVNVLLLGPTGTGKSLLARAIHQNSPRASQRIVELNCAAFNEDLLESELFGAEKGAHSKADRRIEGKVAAAEGGTLFLDEVGEMSMACQSKVLHLLEDHTYYRLGGNQPIRANIRLIAATNVDLQEAVKQRSFREDLYYRLNVMQIQMPSLAERREDIGLIVAYLCAETCKRLGFPPMRVSPHALARAERAPWSGNARELRNAVEAAVILARGEGAEEIAVHHLLQGSQVEPAEALDQSFQAQTERFQRRVLEDALAATDWNVMETARRLGLARSHVYNLIREFGLTRQDRRRP